MAKAFFRFLRGELNGFYITSIQQVCNNLSEEYKTFLQEFSSQQFERDKISAETLNNLGKFAGIFLPRISKEESSTAIRLTESEFDTQLNYQFSERGLFLTDEENFEFEQKTLNEQGLPDINTLATPEKRSSMVESGRQPNGYIPDDVEDVFNDTTVNPDVIESTPPQNQAYSDFYSNDFIFLSDALPSYENLSPDIFLELFKAIQVVRYKGMSVRSLIDITNILCPSGLVMVENILSMDYYIKLEYSTNLEAPVHNQQDRVNMWLYIIKMKFPQIVTQEVSPQ